MIVQFCERTPFADTPVIECNFNSNAPEQERPLVWGPRCISKFRPVKNGIGYMVNGLKSPAGLDIVSCPRLPGRIGEGDTGALLGFNDYELKLVVRHGLLDPLGKPAPNSRKFFCAAEVVALAADREWLDKATRVISKAVREKNSRSQDAVLRPVASRTARKQ